MKYIFLICATLSFTMSYAQDLRSYIPRDAEAVGTINGAKFWESLGTDELSQSKTGKKILKSLSESSQQEVSSINELGFDLQGNVYIYVTQTDSIVYTHVLMPLANSQFLEKAVESNEQEIINAEGYKFAEVDQSVFMAWDGAKLIVTAGVARDKYFEEYNFEAVEIALASINEEKEAEEAIQKEASDVPYTPEIELGYDDMPYFYNYALYEYVGEYYVLCTNLKSAAENNNADMLAELEETSGRLKSMKQAVDSISAPDPDNLDSWIYNNYYFTNQAVEKFADKDHVARAQELLQQTTFYSKDFKIYESEYAETSNVYEMQNYLANKWTKDRLAQAMAISPNPITSNKAYMSQLDQEAAINLWNANIHSSIPQLYMAMYGIIGESKSLEKVMKGYEEFSSNVYFEGSRVRMNYTMGMNQQMADIYEKIGDQKINKKFFRYINEEKMLGYLAYNLNMRNALDEYPKLVAQTYGPLMEGKVDQELELGIELLSVLLDEEAIAELIRGDMLIAFNGINFKEITYTDYEYDDNYEYVAVEKTKQEKLPDFTMMASTKENDFSRKLINYLVNKNLALPENGYYKLHHKEEIPLSLYFVIKDDIFFMSTSAEDMANIVKGTYEGNVSGKHKKMMSQGNLALYFNGKKFGKDFPKDENGLSSSSFEYLLDNSSDFYFTSHKLKDGKMRGEFLMEMPDNQTGLMSYILDLMENIK